MALVTKDSATKFPSKNPPSGALRGLARHCQSHPCDLRPPADIMLELLLAQAFLTVADDKRLGLFILLGDN